MLTPERKSKCGRLDTTLKPIVLVGDQGMSTGLLEELNRALNDHELIKIKVRAERDARKVLIASLRGDWGPMRPVYGRYGPAIQSHGTSKPSFI